MIQSLHTHTTFCDGKDSAENMVLSAIKKGLKSYGFSGHSPVGNECWAMNNEDVKEYIKEINRLKEKYKNEIEIFLGIEGEHVSKLPEYDFDYIISSVHCVEKKGAFLWVDADKTTFKKNINDYYNGDAYKYVKEYYNDIVEASKLGDILGHFDVICKFNKENDLFDEHSETYLNIAKSALIECIKNDIIIEVNTGAIERGYLDRVYPAPYLLNVIKENKGKIIITADAHNVNAIDFYYDETVKLLKNYGFTKQMLLTKNGFIEVDI